jgi:hypothetical protein
VAYLLLVRLGPLRSSMTHATASTAFEGALERYGRSQQMGVGQEDDLLSQRPAEYRPHRPHRHECSDLQGFLAVGTAMSYRPSGDGYRPPRQIPPADRPPGNEPFCRALSSPLVIAVGAGDIFRTSNDGHGLLPLSPQPTILHAQHQQCLTRCFGRLARRSRLLANHAPHAVASFHPLHGRGTTVLAPFLCGRPPVHWAYQVPGEAESLTSLPSAGLPSALG